MYYLNSFPHSLKRSGRGHQSAPSYPPAALAAANPTPAAAAQNLHTCVCVCVCVCVCTRTRLRSHEEHDGAGGWSSSLTNENSPLEAREWDGECPVGSWKCPPDISVTNPSPQISCWMTSSSPILSSSPRRNFCRSYISNILLWSLQKGRSGGRCSHHPTLMSGPELSLMEHTWVSAPVFLLSSCVSSSRSPHLPGPQFPVLENEGE